MGSVRRGCAEGAGGEGRCGGAQRRQAERGAVRRRRLGWRQRRRRECVDRQSALAFHAPSPSTRPHAPTHPPFPRIPAPARVLPPLPARNRLCGQHGAHGQAEHPLVGDRRARRCAPPRRVRCLVMPPAPAAPPHDRLSLHPVRWRHAQERPHYPHRRARRPGRHRWYVQPRRCGVPATVLTRGCLLSGLVGQA